MEDQKVVFDAVQILKLLPHRYPFLLVDKIIEFIDGVSLVAIKNVTANEEFFVGHFPGRPVMPGVLVLETMAQAGAILARASKNGIGEDGNLYLAAANDVKWKRQVVPGDTLRIDMRMTKTKGPWWKMEGLVTIDGHLAASANITAYEVKTESPSTGA